MKFLDDPDVFGPEPEVETGWGFNALVWSEKQRTNYVLRLTWPIARDGGTDAAAATYSHGGNTYYLRNGRVDRGLGDPTGSYSAVYFRRGSWAWV